MVALLVSADAALVTGERVEVTSGTPMPGRPGTADREDELMAQPEEQRRGRAIAMSGEEITDFLGVERTCRVATVGADGTPHVAPLWFLWHGTALWLNSIVRSQRWTDLTREPRIAVVVDAGTEFWELRGVEITGRAEAVGDVPRGTVPVPELIAVERAYARRYSGSDEFRPDGRHGWLRVTPDKIVSWDFRKNPALRSRSADGR